MKEENLTNEKLVKRFTSPFALVTYAANLAKSMSQHGEEHSNLANDVLALIREGKDDIVEEEGNEAVETRTEEVKAVKENKA